MLAMLLLVASPNRFVLVTFRTSSATNYAYAHTNPLALRAAWAKRAPALWLLFWLSVARQRVPVLERVQKVKMASPTPEQLLRNRLSRRLLALVRFASKASVSQHYHYRHLRNNSELSKRSPIKDLALFGNL